MSTNILELDPATELKRFSPADTAIAVMAKQYLPLRINGIDDREGLKEVHEARMVVKSHRVNVEKTRKELKADALAYGRKVDSEAKRITALLEPIEGHLQAEEDAYNEAREQIKQARLQARMDRLAEIEVVLTANSVEMMNDEFFEELVTQKTAEFKARKEAERLAEEQRFAEESRLAKELADREAEEARQRQEEQERMQAERAALEEERRKLDAQRQEEESRLAKERQSIEEQRLAQQQEQARLDESRRQAELEQARKEAAEQARLAEIKRKEDEEKALVAKAAREAEEAARQEALRPDREKLLAVRDAVLAIKVPQVAEELQVERDDICRIIQNAADEIGSIVDR